MKKKAYARGALDSGVCGLTGFSGFLAKSSPTDTEPPTVWVFIPDNKWKALRWQIPNGVERETCKSDLLQPEK